ncbi:MAG: amidase [Pseudomonadales bacterium]
MRREPSLRPATLLGALLLLGLLPGLLLVRTAAARTPDVTELTATTLAEKIRAGELSAAAVTAAYLERIAAIDSAGPTLNAIVELNPEAEANAAALDRYFQAHGSKGPLHGIPVILKANVDTADRMPTHAGSLALADHVAAVDAHLVTRLRNAGAVILGKTNLSEWANFRSNESSSGWSSVGGQTRNPHVLDRNPCGSSSGSAVAVAARLAPLAVGTETDGSIICPSAINGIVGIKPTVGTVSRHGIIPISHTQDTAGPMARSVSDAALLLEVLVDADPADPGARRFPDGPPTFTGAATGTRLDGVRIGVFRNYFGAGELAAVDAIVERSVEQLGRLGAELVDPVALTPDPGMFDAEYQVMLFEFKAGLNAYLADHPVPEDRDTLAELIVWNRDHADTVMPLFGQGVFLEAVDKGGLDDPDYLAALQNGPLRMRAALAAIFAEQDLDALLTAAGSFAWKTDWLAGDRFMVGSSSLAAMSGFPSITVPAGNVRGLPVGVAFVGPPFSEAGLIQIARSFEHATDARLEPRFVPTLETP